MVGTDSVHTMEGRHRATASFRHDEGGVLTIPGTGVLLKVPPKAVPPGKVYIVHGTVHTDLTEYRSLMSSDEEVIVGPVPEFVVESGETFDEPVDIVIPHQLRHGKIRNARVLYGEKGQYTNLQPDDPDVSYSAESDHVCIHTKHFTRFVVTRTGGEMEITEAKLRVWAIREEMGTKAETKLQLYIETGNMRLYPIRLDENLRTIVVFPETEEAIPFPTTHVQLTVDDDCDATPKTEYLKVEDMLTSIHPYGFAEKLADFSLESEVHQQLRCTITVTFEYGHGIPPGVEELRVIYPNRPEDVKEEEMRRSMLAAYEKGLRNGKKTIYRSRLVLIGHYGAGKSNLKRSLLREDFNENHDITNSIDAKPEEAKVDITRTAGWQKHKVEDEHREMVVRFIVQEVQQEKKSTAVDKEKSAASVRKRPRRPGKQAAQDTSHQSASMTQGNEIPEDLAEAAQKEIQKKLMDTLVELFIWDFGGQSVFYNTHMTFLTLQSIYILVMDITKALSDLVPTFRKDQDGLDIPDTGCPQTVADYLDYWCSCIHTFLPPEACCTGATAGQAAKPAIIIVCTHADKCPDQKTSECFLREIRKHIRGKAFENHIHAEIFTLSNKVRDEDAVNRLRERIASLAKDQKYDLPLSWVRFKEEFTKSSQVGVPRKTWNEAKAAGDKVGLNEDDVSAALNFFHQMGDVVYFNEDSLKNFIITDPQWLIDQFRQVITIPKYHEHHFSDSPKHWANLDQKGLLHDAILEHVWPDKDLRNDLVSLMKKFALLCPITSTRLLKRVLDCDDQQAEEMKKKMSLVPSLLPPAPTTSRTDDEKVPPVFLIPPGKFISIGLVSRLIAGLTNEDGWELVGTVYKDEANFLPKHSAISLRIKGEQTVIRISGKKRRRSRKAHGDFFKCLNQVRRRLYTITSTVCPQQRFAVGVRCPECNENGEMMEVNYGQPTYFNCHEDDGDLSKYDMWFQGHISKVADQRRDLISTAKAILQELKEEEARLVGPLGLPETVKTPHFIAIIRSLSMLSDASLEKIETEPMGSKKVTTMIKCLRASSQGKLILFAWALIQVDQQHQLPKSITREVYEDLYLLTREEVVQLATNVDHTRRTSRRTSRCVLL